MHLSIRCQNSKKRGRLTKPAPFLPFSSAYMQKTGLRFAQPGSACRRSLSRRSAHKIENCNKLQLLSLECREAAISKIEGYGLIKTGSMYLGFYTNRCQVCLKGARRQRNFRSETWFRSRGCSKNYVFRQPQGSPQKGLPSDVRLTAAGSQAVPGY